MTASRTVAFLPASHLPLATTTTYSTGRVAAARPSSHSGTFMVPPYDSSSSILSPMLLVSDTMIASSTPIQIQQQQQVQFDAILPDPIVLFGMSLVVVISIVAAIVWNTQVVPVSRTKLAISKQRGPVKDYLNQLRLSSDTTNSSTSHFTTSTGNDDGDNVTDETMPVLVNTNSEEISSNDMMTMDVNNDEGSSNIHSINNNDDKKKNRSFERWLFADWLRDNTLRTKKAPAVPLLPSAKWNSGDNPVLVTTAMMMVGIVVASITERRGVW